MNLILNQQQLIVLYQIESLWHNIRALEYWGIYTLVGVVSKLMQLITLVVVTPLKISLTPMLLGSPKCSKTRLIVFSLEEIKHFKRRTDRRGADCWRKCRSNRSYQTRTDPLKLHVTRRHNRHSMFRMFYDFHHAKRGDYRATRI